MKTRVVKSVAKSIGGLDVLPIILSIQWDGQGLAYSPMVKTRLSRDELMKVRLMSSANPRNLS